LPARQQSIEGIVAGKLAHHDTMLDDRSRATNARLPISARYRAHTKVELGCEAPVESQFLVAQKFAAL
jgi:hypothetical protein